MKGARRRVEGELWLEHKIKSKKEKRKIFSQSDIEHFRKTSERVVVT